MEIFQYPDRRGRKATEIPYPEWYPEDKGEEDEAPGLIQGQRTGSILEWRVYIALARRDIEFIYQYPLGGGRMLRGGQLIDFVVYNPFPIPVNIHGEYWHESELAEEEQLKLARQRQAFNREPIILWGYELDTQEAANNTIDRNIL